MEPSEGRKSVLRQKFKSLRRDFKATDDDREALNRNLRTLLSGFRLSQIALYRARVGEAPCELTPETDYFYPVMDGDHLQFLKPSKKGSFAISEHSIEEPMRDRSIAMDLSKSAVICCPVLATDLDGNRLGLGKGYYDRFFSEHDHFLRVGVIYQLQFSSLPLPADSWDQALDWIVSEKMILRTSTSPKRSFQ